MKTIFLLTMLALSICTTLGSAKEEIYWARITYYTDDGKWGNQVACPDTQYAKKGITVAGHPQFPFGTKVIIPALKGKIGDDGKFVVQDRGSAVTSKKASHGKAFVFDAYVKSEAEVRFYAKKMPEYMRVIVYN